MKKRTILSKLMVATLAMALVFGNGATALTVHAENQYNDDGCYNGDGREGESGFSTGSVTIDTGSTYSEPSYSEPAYSEPSYSEPTYSEPVNYDDGCYHGDGREGESGTSTGNVSIGGGSTATPAPSGLATKGNTVSVAGGQTFRQINKASSGQVAIYHCGIEQYTAQLLDASGKAVAYASAGAYKDEATGKWYLNLTTANGVDTTGYTVGTWKGSVDYLPKLGMSGVTLNGVVVVDAEAAAAAAAK